MIVVYLHPIKDYGYVDPSCPFWMVPGWILPGDWSFWNIMINQWKWIMIRYRWMMSFFLLLSLRRKSGLELMWRGNCLDLIVCYRSSSSSNNNNNRRRRRRPWPRNTRSISVPFTKLIICLSKVSPAMCMIIVTILIIYPTLLYRLSNSYPPRTGLLLSPPGPSQFPTPPRGCCRQSWYDDVIWCRQPKLLWIW